MVGDAEVLEGRGKVATEGGVDGGRERGRRRRWRRDEVELGQVRPDVAPAAGQHAGARGGGGGAEADQDLVQQRVGEAADAVVAGAAAASSKMGSMNIGEHVLSFVELEIGVK